MNCRERFHAVMNFEKSDRIPKYELSAWWNETINNWNKDPNFNYEEFNKDTFGYFGLDKHVQLIITNRKDNFPFVTHGSPQIINEKDYMEYKNKYLYPDDFVSKWADYFKQVKKSQSTGEITNSVIVEGFFWFPRTLFGIENHFYSFYDYPELMHQINNDACDFYIETFKKYFEILIPDYVIFAEDMSYNHGPMISKELFDEFMAPYYKRLLKFLKEKNILIMVDSDGNIEELIPWLLEVGVDGFSPLERQAGTDINRIREKYPKVRLMSGFDKMVMDKGEDAIRKEFDRIFNVMKQGGYIPGVDHQTPPNVTLDQYKLYLKIQEEYCIKAVINNNSY